ncbi:hypothetical protein D9615_006302 [Tricholomella constricta]|uniref:Uncharacterized protein n=1 Tax=Tricholomella constricta TaxID=117010 RepID=A0A8H5M435_9AGAR|nr:hypothetical protein D9615_006302 [Tricholomella constricta]
MSDLTIEVKAQFHWNLVFDYDNTGNTGSIVQEYKIKMSGSYTSKTYMETVSSNTRKFAESNEIELATGASYGPVSANLKNTSHTSKEVTDMLQNTTSHQTEETEQWSQEEKRSYTVGPHSRVCLYQRSFEAAGMYVKEDVFRTTPAPLPKEELNEEDTVITDVRPKSFLTALKVVYTSSEIDAPGDRITDVNGGSSDINKGFDGKFVVWFPRKSVSCLMDSVCIDDEDKRYDDLAKDAGGQFRYLIPVKETGDDVLLTEAKLLRSSNSVDSHEFAGKTRDINAGRDGDYLYVVWNTERAYPV